MKKIGVLSCIYYRIHFGGIAMLKKIIAFAAAAVSAVSVLSCTAWAGNTDGREFAADDMVRCEGYIDKWETVVDKSGLIQAYRVELPDENDPTVGTVYYADKNNKKLNGLLYANMAYPDSTVPKFLMAEFKDGNIKRYVSGFTKSSEGKRYYINGERAYGWHKIKGCWYHFNTKSGYMDTGKTTVGGSVYTFDEKGRWTYRVSKDGLAPKDFFVRFIGNPSDGFDTKDKKLYYGQNEDGTAETSIKISVRDRQILWCMYLESGFAQGSGETFDEDYITGFCESFFEPDVEFDVYSSIPEIVYDIAVNVGDTSAKLSYNTDAEQIALIDEKTFRAGLLYGGYGRYLKELKEKYPYEGGPLMMLE